MAATGSKARVQIKRPNPPKPRVLVAPVSSAPEMKGCAVTVSDLVTDLILSTSAVTTDLLSNNVVTSLAITDMQLTALEVFSEKCD